MPETDLEKNLKKALGENYGRFEQYLIKKRTDIYGFSKNVTELKGSKGIPYIKEILGEIGVENEEIPGMSMEMFAIIAVETAPEIGNDDEIDKTLKRIFDLVNT